MLERKEGREMLEACVKTMKKEVFLVLGESSYVFLLNCFCIYLTDY